MARYRLCGGLAIMPEQMCIRDRIMPMFSIGALLGCSLGLATGAPAGFSAALGMAAFFAAAGRCPLTALLMGAEIFGWLALPFLLIARCV